jgi:hypothetical protein
LSVLPDTITKQTNERENLMGNILDELTDILAIECDECGGAGILFFGDNDNFDCEPCDCVTDEELI